MDSADSTVICLVNSPVDSMSPKQSKGNSFHGGFLLSSLAPLGDSRLPLLPDLALLLTLVSRGVSSLSSTCKGSSCAASSLRAKVVEFLGPLPAPARPSPLLRLLLLPVPFLSGAGASPSRPPASGTSGMGTASLLLDLLGGSAAPVTVRVRPLQVACRPGRRPAARRGTTECWSSLGTGCETCRESDRACRGDVATPCHGESAFCEVPETCREEPETCREDIETVELLLLERSKR
mmetsp:Transcript_58492/g.174065  ORF Transcript_58492/g.174065 Transcript_58492/m.174065 type:complete len:236 (-) Transcript_58492:623-1330(-)